MTFSEMEYLTKKNTFSMIFVYIYINICSDFFCDGLPVYHFPPKLQGTRGCAPISDTPICLLYHVFVFW